MSGIASNWFQRKTAKAVEQTLFAVALLLTLERAGLIGSAMSLDPNEGWNAFQAEAARHLVSLYPPPGSFVANNYPPLSFILIGWSAPPSADLIVTGRIVSLISSVIVASVIFVLARRLADARPDTARLAPLIFLVFNATAFRGYLAINDPQWLGHAFMSVGLLVLLWDEPSARIPLPRALGSALFMLAGLMVKHNIVAIPGAAAIWLAVYDRRALALWCLVGLLGLAGIAWLNAVIFEGHFIPDVLRPPRTYSVLRMMVHGLLALLFVPLLWAGVGLLKWRAYDSRLTVLVIGVGLSLLLAVIEGSGAGVDVNAYFEALIFVALTCAVGLAKSDHSRALAMALATLLVLLPVGVAETFEEFRNAPASIASSRHMADRVRAIRGPAACESLALCYWAGKSFELDFFAYDQLLATGRDQGSFRSALDSHRFAAVELETSPTSKVLTPIQTMVASAYRPLMRSKERSLYVPK